MRHPRFSLGTLVLLVAVIAVNCAWYRDFYEQQESAFGFRQSFVVCDIPIIASLDLLTLGLYQLLRSRGRPFRVGFVVGVLLTFPADVAYARWLVVTTPFTPELTVPFDPSNADCVREITAEEKDQFRVAVELFHAREAATMFAISLALDILAGVSGGLVARALSGRFP